MADTPNIPEHEQTKGSRHSGPYYNHYPPHPHPFWEESTLGYYLNVIRRRAWTVGAVFIVVLTIGAVNAYRAPRIYQAVAKVLVERQVPRVMRFDGLTQDAGWDPEFYSTQVELIRSRATLEKALEQPDLARLLKRQAADAAGTTSLLQEIRRTMVALLGAVPPPPPEAWEVLRGQIGVQILRDTHFLLIKADSMDPVRAATLVNGVANAFAQYHIERRTESLGEAVLFLDREKAKQEQLLAKAEKELQEFRETAKEVTLSDNEADQPALKRLTELSEKLTQVQFERIELTAQMKVVHDVLSSSKGLPHETDERLVSLASVRTDPAVAAVQASLTEARKQVDKLSEVYGPEHPLLKDAKSNVLVLQRQFRDVLSQLVLSLEGRLQMMQNQEDELLKEEGLQKSHAMDLAKEVFTFTQLKNAMASHRKLYDMLNERLREVDVSSGFIKTNVQVIEKASVPVTPISPNRGRILFLSTLLGLCLGVGLGFVFENLDDTIKTPEDLKRRVNMPLLGFVPRVDVKPESKGRTNGEARVTGLISIQEPVSSVAEAYRNLRTSLLFSIPAGESKILGVTSANPGEGKTTTVCNLAVVMAMSGKNVLLIDADIHRPMVNEVFGFEDGVGLTNVLAGEAELSAAIRQFKFNSPVAGRLSIIQAGPESPNPSELIGSQRMKDILAQVRGSYDWVFVDIPPVLYISDATIMSALCEGIILVVRANKNNRSILTRTRERLEELKVRIVGCVLNDVVLSRLGRYYSDYAYYGYSKYSSKYHKSYYARREKGKGKKKAEGGNLKPEEGRDGQPEAGKGGQA